jgi:hypothetical protein
MYLTKIRHSPNNIPSIKEGKYANYNQGKLGKSKAYLRNLQFQIISSERVNISTNKCCESWQARENCDKAPKPAAKTNTATSELQESKRGKAK